MRNCDVLQTHGITVAIYVLDDTPNKPSLRCDATFERT